MTYGKDDLGWLQRLRQGAGGAVSSDSLTRPGVRPGTGVTARAPVTPVQYSGLRICAASSEV